jgi:hypothetical protein
MKFARAQPSPDGLPDQPTWTEERGWLCTCGAPIIPALLLTQSLTHRCPTCGRWWQYYATLGWQHMIPVEEHQEPAT